MPAKILDGKETARVIRSEIAACVDQWLSGGNPVPTLAAVLVGDDPASQVYVRNKTKACQEVGMESRVIRKPADTTTDELLDLVRSLNDDGEVHAILVQLPLPDGIDSQRVVDSISPRKDVDAFTPINVGLLVHGRAAFLPCTPHGILQLLGRNNIQVAGKHVVIVGRSEIVGKPMAMMLVQKNCELGNQLANATVTLCHSRSEGLTEITRQADILIVAVGKPSLITASMVRPGATVIDVGINRVGNRLVGDVDFDAVREIASAITPVPGGIGPLTIAMLLFNTLRACELQTERSKSDRCEEV